MLSAPYWVAINSWKMPERKNNWLIELLSYKLNIKYVTGNKNIIVNCLSRIVDAN